MLAAFNLLFVNLTGAFFLLSSARLPTGYWILPLNPVFGFQILQLIQPD